MFELLARLTWLHSRVARSTAPGDTVETCMVTPSPGLSFSLSHPGPFGVTKKWIKKEKST